MKKLVTVQKTNFKPFLGDLEDVEGLEPLFCKSFSMAFKKRLYGFPCPIVCDIYENVTIAFRPSLFVVEQRAVYYMGLS